MKDLKFTKEKTLESRMFDLRTNKIDWQYVEYNIFYGNRNFIVTTWNEYIERNVYYSWNRETQKFYKYRMTALNLETKEFLDSDKGNISFRKGEYSELNELKKSIRYYTPKQGIEIVMIQQF